MLIGIVLLSSCASSKKTSRQSKMAVVSQVERLSPEMQRKHDYFFLEATRLKSKGDYDAAFELFEHCLAIDPTSPSASYELSQFYIYLKQNDKALSGMEKAVEGDPGNYWYKQSLAALYQSQGNTQKAIGTFESMSDYFADRQEPLIALIDLYNAAKDYPNVIKTLDRLEAKTGKTEQISMEKFRVYLQMDNNKKAFKEIENLANEYPNDMRYLSILGDVYLNNGKPKDAYDTYQKVLAVEPDNAMALLSMSTYYQQTGQMDRYEQQLDSVLLNKKVDSSTKVEVMRQLISRTEQTQQDSIKILSLFDNILKQDQEDTQIPMLYSQYLIAKGLEKDAIPVLNLITRLDPENVPARLQLLSYAIKKNDFDEAIRICEPAIESTPETLEFYFYLGIAYYQAQRIDDALAIYNKGLTHVNETSNKEIVSEFYSMLGDIYHTKNKITEAYAAYDSSLVYNANNIAALNNYAYYLSVERKNLDKAEEMSYKTVKAQPKNGTYLDTYAWILFEKGNYTLAKVYIDDAMKNGGNESEIVVEHCGDIYFMNGQPEEALKYWLKSKEMGNKSETLKKKIEQKKIIAE